MDHNEAEHFTADSVELNKVKYTHDIIVLYSFLNKTIFFFFW